jgi:hypothetical protein
MFIEAWYTGPLAFIIGLVIGVIAGGGAGAVGTYLYYSRVVSGLKAAASLKNAVTGK